MISVVIDDDGGDDGGGGGGGGDNDLMTISVVSVMNMMKLTMGVVTVLMNMATSAMMGVLLATTTPPHLSSHPSNVGCLVQNLLYSEYYNVEVGSESYLR